MIPAKIFIGIEETEEVSAPSAGNDDIPVDSEAIQNIGTDLSEDDGVIFNSGDDTTVDSETVLNIGGDELEDGSSELGFTEDIVGEIKVRHQQPQMI